MALDETSGPGRSPEVTGRRDNPLGFALDFLGGKAHLTLGRRRLAGFVRLERLAQEVPRVSFPFDVSGGAGRFRHRRCRLRRLEAIVEPEAFGSWLTSLPQLSAFGFGQVHFEWRPGEVRVEAVASLGDRQVPFTARLRVGADPDGWVRLELGRWQVYGYLPMPPALLGVGMLAAAGIRPAPLPEGDGATPAGSPPGSRGDPGEPPPWPRRLYSLEGTSTVRVDLLGLLLRELLPAYGWRLPWRDEVVLESLTLGPEGLSLAWAPREDIEGGGTALADQEALGAEEPQGLVEEHRAPSARSAEAPDLDEVAGEGLGARGVREAERRLALGLLDEALRGYEERLTEASQDLFARRRRMEILACTHRTLPEARRLARRLLVETGPALDAPTPLARLGGPGGDRGPLGGGEVQDDGTSSGEPPRATVLEGASGDDRQGLLRESAVAALFVLASTAEELAEPVEAASRYAVLSSLAERQGDLHEAVLASLACGRLLTGPEPEQAISWYERSLGLEADLPEAVAALSGLYRRQGRIPDLIRLVRKHLAQATDRRERLRGHLTLGRLYLDPLGDALRARAEFERAVRLFDGSLAAWDGLAEAHRRAGNHDRERRALERVIELSATQGDAEAVKRAKLRMARAWAEAGDRARSLEVTGALLRSHPDDPEALELHGMTSAQAGLWDGAAETLERLLSLEGLPTERRSEVALELARIRLEGLGDAAGARIFLEVSLAIEERAEALRLALLLAEREARLADRAELLGRLADRRDLDAERAEAAGRFEEKATAIEESAWARIEQARLWGVELGDVEQALSALAPLLGGAEPSMVFPASPGVREALLLQARLLRESGAREALGVATSRLGEWIFDSGAAPVEEEMELLLEHADALCRPLDGGREALRASRRTEALRGLRRLHAAAPQDPRPLVALTDLLDGPEEQAEREGLLERLASVTERKGDAARQAAALRELGNLRRQQGRHEEAAAALRAAARLTPGDGALQAELGELAYSQSSWEEAEVALGASLRGTPGPREPARVALRLGQLALRKGELEAGIRIVEGALSADPPPLGPLAVECHQALLEGLSLAGRWREAACALEAMAANERTLEPRAARAAALFAAAEIQRRRVGDADAAERLYEAVSAADPDHLGALNGLTVLCASAGRWDRVADLLERKLALLSGTGEAVPILEELAALYRTRLQRPQAARSVFERILEQDLDHREALRFVADDAFACGDLEVARRNYQRLLSWRSGADVEEIEESSTDRLAIHWSLARIALRTGEVGSAASELSAVLLLDPTDARALETLDGLFDAQGRWEELAEVLRRRADQASAAGEAVGLLLRLATLLEERLGKLPEAVSVCREVLRREPHRLEALARQAGLLRRLGADALERRRILERLIDGMPEEGAPSSKALQGPDRLGLPSRPCLLLELGLLLRRELGEPQTGARLLLQARAQGCEEVALHHELAAVAREEHRPEALVCALQDLSEATPDRREREVALLELAEVRLSELQDVTGALQALGGIPSAERPDQALAVEARCREAAQQWAEALGLYETLAERARDRGDEAVERGARERLLALALGVVDDLSTVERTAARLLELDPRHLGGLDALASVARRTRKAPALLQAIERKVSVLGEGGAEIAAESLCEAARLCLQMGDWVGGAERAARAIERDPDSLEPRRLQAECLALGGETGASVLILEDLARRLGSRRPVEGEPRRFLGLLYREVAALVSERMGEGERARRAWRAAAGLLSGPSLIGVLEAWAASAGREGRWSEAAEVIERLRAQRGVLADALALAEAYEHLGRVDEALRVLREAPAPGGPEEEALSSKVRDRVRELLAAAGRFGELARTLEEDARRGREPSQRRHLLLQAAEHYRDRAGEGRRAERCFLSLLEEDPLCPGAVRGLLERAEASTRTAAVEAALLRSAEAALEVFGAPLPPGEAGEELQELVSRIAHHRLEVDEDDAPAQRWLGALLSVAPARQLDLERHGAYLLREGQPEQLVTCLEAALATAGLGPEVEGALRRRAARICADLLGDPARALAVLLPGDTGGSAPRKGEALALEADLLERLERLREAEEALLRLAEEQSPSAPLLLRALSLADRRGDRASAIQIAWRIARLSAAPEERVGRLTEVAKRCEEGGDPEGRASALEELATLAFSSEERAAWHLERGRVLIHLERWEEAQKALLEAAKAAPGTVLVHRELGRVALHRGDLAAARVALATAHDLLPEAAHEERAAVSLARSEVEVELQGDRALARRFARQAAEETRMAALRAEALRRAASLSAVLEEPGQEEEALRALFELGVAEIGELGRLATLCEGRDAWAEALDVHEHLREAEPQSPEVRRRLAAALLATGQRGRAVAELVAAAERFAARGECVLASQTFLEAAAQRLAGDASAAEARALLLSAVSADPHSDVAFGQAARLCRQHRDYEGLLEALRRRLPALDAVGQQAAYREMAAVAREGLRDPDRAASYLALGLVAGGDEPLLLAALLEYHSARLEWPMALDYGRRLDAVGGPPADQAFELHGRLVEGALATGERALARTHLRRALAVRPGDSSTRQRLETLLLEDGDHAALLELWKERAAAEEGGERAQTLCRAAALCERHLGDLALAEQLQWDALEASPEDEALREGLIALLRRQEHWQPLFDQLRIAHEVARGPRRAELADELAELAGRRLDDPSTAQHFRRVALRDAPADVSRLRSLVDLLAAERKWADLAEVLEEALHTMVLDADSASGFYALLGRSYMEKLARPDLALAVFERARARGALTPRSGERLAELLESSGRFTDLAALLDELAERLKDPAASQRLLVKRARVLADHLGRPGEAASQILTLFRLAPQRRLKLGALARKLFVQARMVDDALRVLEEELQASSGPEQVEILLERGALLEDTLHRPADALTSYARVLEVAPGHPVAHHRVALLLFDKGEREEALVHVEEALKSGAPDLLAPAHRLAGNLCVELDRLEEAVEHFEASLRLEPTDLELVKELNHLYTAGGQWDRLAENMGRELSLTVEPAVRGRLWFRRGLVYRDMLDRGGDALRCFREAASADPSNAEVVAALRDFALERGDWETSLGLLDRQLELERDLQVRRQLLARRAELLEHRLGRPEDAIAALEEALSLQGGTDAVLMGKLLRLRLSRKEWSLAAALERQLGLSLKEASSRADALLRVAALHQRAGEYESAWTAAMEVFEGPSEEHLLQAAERLLEVASTPARKATLRGLFEARLAGLTDPQARGALLRHGLQLAEAAGDTARADALAGALFTADPTDRAALGHRRRRLEEEGRFEELVQLLTNRLAVASREESLDLLTSIGRLQRERLGDLVAAGRTFDQLLALQPDDLAALDARADLAYRQGEFLEARNLYERIGERSGTLEAAELSFRLGRIAEALGEEEAAVAAYRRVLTSQPNHVPVLEALTRLHLLHGQGAEALPVLAALCEELPPSDRALACGLQLARLQMELGHGEEAEAGLRSMAALYPDKRPVLERLAEVQRGLGRWSALAETLAELARRAPNVERRAHLLHEEGEIRLQRLHEPEAAARRFLQAADLAPLDPGILRRLAEHYAQIGRWEESRKAFTQLLEVLSTLETAGEEPRRGEATLGLALTALLEGGETAREAPLLIRQMAVESVDATQAAEVLAPLAQGLHVLGQSIPGLRRVFDLVDSALGRASLPRWAEAAERLAADRPADLGLRRLLIRLISRVGESGLADLHEAAARFLDPPSTEGTPPPPASLRAAPRRSLAVFGPAVTEAARVPLRTLLTGLHPALGRVATPLDPSALGPEVEETQSPELALLCDELRGALEVGPLGVVFARQAQRPVDLLYSHPPVMLLDPALLSLPLGQVRFLIGRALEWVRSGSLILLSEPLERVQEILDAVALLFGVPLPDGGRAGSALVERLQSRGLSPELFDNQTMEALQVAFFNHYRRPVALDRYLEEERHVANRMGLLAGGDLEGALEALALETLPGRVAELPREAPERRRLVHSEPALGELLRFGTSALYHQLRRHRSTLPRL